MMSPAQGGGAQIPDFWIEFCTVEAFHLYKGII